MKISLTICFAIILLSGISFAQDESPFTVEKLTDNITQLITNEGSYTTNILVFDGADGLLLVDTNTKENAEELKKIIDSFGKGLPKYIINTHRHVEHIGGNAIFGPDPVIIGHDLIRKRLRSGGYLFDEWPEITMPDIAITDSIYLYFNGEKIRLIPLAGSHDDNEIIVHFTDSKIVHLSSLVNGLNFPSVDSDGDVLKFDELVDRAIEVLPEDVTIVSGHNNNCGWHDLHNYRDMVKQTTKIVRDGLAKGKTVEQMQEEKVFAGFESYAQSYVSPEGWIEYLADGIEGGEEKKSIMEPMYYAYKDGGADGAIKEFQRLKSENADEYEFQEVELVVIGIKLNGKKEYDGSNKIFELSLKEYPDGEYRYYAYYIMSQSYRDLGQIDEAIKHCEKSIEANSEFQDGPALLEELKKMK